MIKNRAIEKNQKSWERSDYNQIDWDEMRDSEKDQNLPKLLHASSCVYK